MSETHVEHKARTLRDFLDHDHVVHDRHYQPWQYGDDGVVRRQLRALCKQLLSEIDVAARLHSPDRAPAYQHVPCVRCLEGDQEFGGLCRWCDAFEHGDDYQLGNRAHKGGRVLAMEPTNVHDGPGLLYRFTLFDRVLVEGEALEVLLDHASGQEPWEWKAGVFKIVSDRSVPATASVVTSTPEYIGCKGRRVRRIADKLPPEIQRL
jgi:hypothetical protein